jgi:hypothetical protein
MYAFTSPFPRIPTRIPDAFGGLVGDFAKEIGSEFAYFSSRIKHRPGPTKPSLGQAFNVEGYAPVGVESRVDDAYASYTMRTSNDDDIRLESYKPTARDLSQDGSHEQYDEYKPGPPLAA